jgi:hypothetical protein
MVATYEYQIADKLLSWKQLCAGLAPRMASGKAPNARWYTKMRPVLPYVSIPGSPLRFYLLEVVWQFICSQIVFPAPSLAHCDPPPRQGEKRAVATVEVSRIRRAVLAEVLDADQPKRGRGRPRKAAAQPALDRTG